MASRGKGSNSHCQWCSAVNCRNSRNNRPDLSFFRFPKDPERSKKWVVNCRRADLDKKTPDALFKGNVLCSEHFERTCFTSSGKKLSKTAVPTLFNIPNPPPSLTPKRPAPKVRHTESSCKLDAPLTATASPSPNVIPDTFVSDVAPKDTESTILQLKRKLSSQRSKLFRANKKLKLADTTNRDGDTGNVASSASEQEVQGFNLDSVRDSLAPFLSGPALEFVLTQVRVSGLKARARRWTHSDKSLALALFHTSKKAYFLLQKIFKLPSPKTLCSSMKNLHISPGFPHSLLQLFQIKVHAMTSMDRTCALIFDEISLKSAVQYDPVDDLVEGFEDYGQQGRSQHIANYALVFMVRGLCSKWKQPFAYILTHGPVKAGMLMTLVQEAIQHLVRLGLIVKVIICDQGSNNRSVFSHLGITKDKPYFHTPQGEKVFAMYDPPHLIKSVRNNFKQYGFTIDDKQVSWEHIVSFYNNDCRSPIRLAPKLTKRHVELPVFSKLRVSLAVQILSHTVAAGISTMVTLGALPPSAAATAVFVENFDQLFNCFNSKTIRSKNVMGNAISASSEHMQFLARMKTWVAAIKCNNSSGTLPCLQGWLLTINCLTQLWEELQSQHGFKFLLTNRLNQDCLENLFAIIRGKGGHRCNPSPFEFKVALRQTMVDSVLVQSSAQNCAEDLDTFLFSLKNISSHGSNTEIKSRLQLDIPPDLHKLVSATPTNPPTMTSTEDNIISYIAGYLTFKLSPRLCPSCVELLRGNKDATQSQNTFLCAKNFQGATTGLQAPSALLFVVCQEMEDIFRKCVPPALHTTGIRSLAIRHMVKAPHCQFLSCSQKKCDLMFSIVCLYANVRLHHHIRSKNREHYTSTKKTSKKAAILRHQ